jgi:hypothetical protein
VGLFSSVLHLRDVPRERVLPTLDEICRGAGFPDVETMRVAPDEGGGLPDRRALVSSGPCYLLSPLNGRWLTVLEAHFALERAPDLSDVGNRLSDVLQCHALTLVVHDDDLLFYTLDRNGTTLDKYNSNPQYFDVERLSVAQIEPQRHRLEPFAQILPDGCSLDDVRALLNRGWWDAYNSEALDEHGTPRDGDYGFVFEGERMTALGTLLQLHGAHGEYPYAAWGGSTAIPWAEFVVLRGSR